MTKINYIDMTHAKYFFRIDFADANIFILHIFICIGPAEAKENSKTKVFGETRVWSALIF
jgi:hypothetical protein